jgi:hypothetical protein
METLSVHLLPEYTPSKPAPDYSSKLLPGEKCIQRSPYSVQRGDNASFTYRERGMTLKLVGCREEDRHPSYGLGSTIRGEVALDNRQRVVAVAAKVCGICYVQFFTTSFLILLIAWRSCIHFRATIQGGKFCGKGADTMGELYSKWTNLSQHHAIINVFSKLLSRTWPGSSYPLATVLWAIATATCGHSLHTADHCHKVEKRASDWKKTLEASAQ